jgi:DNA recombination protein RmuC
MTTAILVLSFVQCLLLLGLLYHLLRLRTMQGEVAGIPAQLSPELQRLDTSFRDEISRQKMELGTKLDQQQVQVLERADSLRTRIEERLESIRSSTENKLQQFAELADGRHNRLRTELVEASTKTRTELQQQLQGFQERLTTQQTNLRVEVAQQLDVLRQSNEQRLEQIRVTVNEQLQSTLEKRLNESFKLVSERLEQVHKGLGEMGEIASSVGDLRRVLTNVKTRGTWGEVQLGAILSDILTPDQFRENVAAVPGSREFVEFAISLPGKDGQQGPVWLPVDSKFPMEDYQRLQEAAEKGDAVAVEAAGKALEMAVRGFAKSMAGKYISPPHTTDFALLFLPSESLYAEVLRRRGMVEGLQNDFRIVVTGPSTLAALLNSLRMGFRTLAIQQKSAEVWQVLGAVKTEFAKFNDVLVRVKKKLDEASNQIDETGVRTRAISRKLREVEALPEADAARLIPASNSTHDDEAT